VAPLSSVSALSFSISELSYLHFPLSVLLSGTQSDKRLHHSTYTWSTSEYGYKCIHCRTRYSTSNLQVDSCTGRNSNFYTCELRTRAEGDRNAQEWRDGNRPIYYVQHQFRTYWPLAYLCSTQLNWSKVIVFVSLEGKTLFLQWKWYWVQ
jgi:hypothetical protein